MKILEYILLVSIIAILFCCGCEFNCRPMQVGLTWVEWENIRQPLLGNYVKTCTYTTVTEEKYTYDCWYNGEI